MVFPPKSRLSYLFKSICYNLQHVLHIILFKNRLISLSFNELIKYLVYKMTQEGKINPHYRSGHGAFFLNCLFFFFNRQHKTQRYSPIHHSKV